jgi:predicted HicB family RNase H-like nuclease
VLASLLLTALLTAFLLIPAAAANLSQSAGQTAQSQDQSPPAPQTSPAKPPASKNTAAKVWTNDDLPTTTEPSPRSNGQKKGSKQDTTAGQDSTYTASVKKQLDKLQEQLADTDKQLSGLKNFRNGENVSTAGVDIHQGINRTPVDQQIASLEAKKKQLQGKIDDLLDEARKKGVEPGQLR